MAWGKSPNCPNSHIGPGVSVGVEMMVSVGVGVLVGVGDKVGDGTKVGVSSGVAVSSDVFDEPQPAMSRQIRITIEMSRVCIGYPLYHVINVIAAPTMNNPITFKMTVISQMTVIWQTIVKDPMEFPIRSFVSGNYVTKMHTPARQFCGQCLVVRARFPRWF